MKHYYGGHHGGRTIRPLRRGEAEKTLAARLAPCVDRVRQLQTKIGIRSKRVFLVWSYFTGQEIGDGEEKIFKRIEILPTPQVSELTTQNFNLFSVGVFPVGSLKVDEISATIPKGYLTGKTPPASKDERLGTDIKRKYNFWWEVQSDDRHEGDDKTVAKYRLLAPPSLDEDDVMWVCAIERISEDVREPMESAYGTEPWEPGDVDEDDG